MKKITIYLLPVFLISCLYSCKENKNEYLIGKWRSVKIENRDKDDFFRNSKEFIDTMGNSNDAAANIEMYGVSNIDSLRRELRIQFDSAYAAQLGIDTQSVFTFKYDSIVIFSFPGKAEQGKWHVDTEGKLVLDEINDLGETEHLSVDINKIDDNTMKLTFIRELEQSLSDTSIVTFRREKN
jgi:hypothetical protein